MPFSSNGALTEKLILLNCGLISWISARLEINLFAFSRSVIVAVLAKIAFW